MPMKMPPSARKHTEETLKLVASGFQLLALALLGAGLIAPFFNNALNAPLRIKLATAFVAVISESAALLALRYIPFPVDA